MILDDALKYLKQGFPAIPMSPTDKRPLVKWSEFQERMPSEQETKEMFLKYPKAMCGLVTGQISGICVVDCDSPEACEKIDSILPETFETAIAISPRGGRHYYFRCPDDLQTKAAVLPQVDVRAAGGVIVAPPSVNLQGLQYRWLNELELTQEALQEMPASLLCILKDAPLNKNKHTSTIGGVDKLVDTTTLFSEGRRDNDLFTLANSLVKSGMPERDIFKYLEFIVRSWGERDESWINAKIQSALKRQEKRERNLSEEIREYVLSTNGNFLSTDVYNCLQLSTRDERKNVSIVLARLRDEGLIERYGDRNGCFRKINRDLVEIKWMDAKVSPLSIRWPFQIENLVRILPKNIIVVAGETDAGKTAFLLNFVKMNMHQHEISYFSSEMGEDEMRDRISNFDLPFDQWRFKTYEKSDNFADVIRPDGVNIIDYIEMSTDFYKISGYIKDIFDKLKNGIAIIALQKNPKIDYGLGGMRSAEKARLYLSLEPGRCKIVKAKNWVDHTKNPNKLIIEYSLVKGCKFISKSGWRKGD